MDGPAGGVMLGVHRDVRPGRETSYEFFRIAETTEGLIYYASPGGRPPVPFTAAEVGPRHVVFENVLHDYPQHILYRVSADGDTLTAGIEGPDGEGGRRAVNWTWVRVKDGF